MKFDSPGAAPIKVVLDKCSVCQSVIRRHESGEVAPANVMDMIQFPISEMRLTGDLMMVVRLKKNMGDTGWICII